MSVSLLLRKNLFRGKLRTILCIVTAVCAFAVYAVLAVYGRAYDFGVGPWAANRMSTVNRVSYTRPLPRSYVERVAAVPGVRQVTYGTFFAGYVGSPMNQVQTYAVDPASWLDIYSEYVLPADQRQCLLREKDGIVIGAAVARRLGWRVGDNVTLNSLAYSRADGSNAFPLRVCGIFHGRSRMAITGGAYLRYDFFQEQTAGSGDVGIITFVTASPADNARVGSAVDDLFVDSDAPTTTYGANEFVRVFSDERGNFRMLITVASGAAFLTLLLIVGNALAMAVRERGREFAILRALGFPRRRLFALVAGEGLVIVLTGGIVGLLTGGLLVAATGNPRAFMVYGNLPGTTLLMIVLGLAVAVLPALRASRTRADHILTRE